jgi:3-ketoacyl-CoA synthase
MRLLGICNIGLGTQNFLCSGGKQLSTENITGNCCLGEDRSMILINCFFRVGGAAILLSNKPSDSHVAKYQVIHAVRPNTAASDSSYNCVTRLEDSQGLLGITTTKDLIQEAIKTIEANLTTLGHSVLPISEKIQFIANYIAMHFSGAKVKPYVPNFMKAIDHVITHDGGKHVLVCSMKWRKTSS